MSHARKILTSYEVAEHSKVVLTLFDQKVVADSQADELTFQKHLQTFLKLNIDDLKHTKSIR